MTGADGGRSPVPGLRRHLADGVLKITLDRSDRLNALRWEMVEGLVRWVGDAGVDPDVRVVIVTGAGRAFCSGDDIVDGMDDSGRDRSGLRRRLLDTATRGPHHELVRSLLGVPKPVVAALNGPCHGAGWVIALACDFRVAHDDVVLGDIRAQKAIFANQGAGLLLPRLIGQSRAMDLLMTGRVIDAREAERYGLLARVWPAATFERELATFTVDLAAGPTSTYAAWKLSVNRALLLELDAYTDHERWLELGQVISDDRIEGIAAFREKRPPRFTGY
jgi:2-(1,2-epoxy-1,2-dihydrophenyl)acetyl-CoA isomerase